MPTEFSLFSGLPTELREEIWNLTIRPKYLGVHIFRVYNTNLDHENPPQEVIHFSRNKSCRRERHELDLAVPLAGKELEGTNDPSAKNYNLKRKANTPPYRNGLFYAGDRKLIELDFLGEDSRNHWEYIEPVPDGDYEKSSFEFVEQLHAYYEEAREDGPEAFFTLL
ncbi:hypothetical protein FOC1_g10005481 [Fusarium oxysporum f. sp. cubense race 1]|uniref:2EXR domain-containing protein n=1 Tax=Fusarium oxysporum f. sp. cubense (strain race 1) TaxID=1229664 RepID=N4UW61_FUSC1|nr:hypothetical protein FOC1_g10005481 [Fusarium oxysporum f. sp. cubense race 1]